jgi:hypothetical protein
MKKLGIAACVMGLTALFASEGVYAQGMPRFYGQCSGSYRADSYGSGIEEAFTGVNMRPQMLDEGCYRMGVTSGQATWKIAVDAREDRVCRHDFLEGRAQGFQASVHASGSACYNSGYLAGRAYLHIGAREKNTGVVGSRCVSEYMRGWNDGKAHQVANGSASDTQEWDCYMTGWNDGWVQ